MQNPNRMHRQCSIGGYSGKDCTSIPCNRSAASLSQLRAKPPREARQTENAQSLFSPGVHGWRTPEANKHKARVLAGPVQIPSQAIARRESTGIEPPTQCPYRSSEYEISHWDRECCRRASRGPSARREFSDRCGIVRRWESSRRSGCTRSPCETLRATPGLRP